MKPTDPRLQLIAKIAGVRPPHVFATWHAMADQKKAFSVKAFAMFCGMEDRHIEAIVKALNDENMHPAPQARAAGERGQRLAKDYVVAPALIDWAMQERTWTREEAQTEAANFLDYWHGATGVRATKKDWDAAWRVWARNSHRKGTGVKHMTLAPVEPDDNAQALRELHTRYQAGDMTFDAYMARKMKLLGKT